MKEKLSKYIPIIIVVVIAAGVFSSYYRKKTVEAPQIIAVENLSGKEKEAYDLAERFGQFYYLDRDVTIENVMELRDIFNVEIQNEIGIDDEKITEYTNNVKESGSKFEFLEATNPRIMKSDNESVIMSVDLKVKVLESSSVESGEYIQGLTVGVENGKIVAFKPGEAKKVE